MLKSALNQKGVFHLLPLLLIGVVGVLAFLFISSNAPLKDGLLNFLYKKAPSHASTTGTVCETTQVNTACLFLSPTTVSATQNNNFQVEVRVNSNGTPVNAGEVIISYPDSSLEYVSTDGTGSGFNLEGPTTTGTGTITLSRGTVTPVNGEALFATVTFKPIVAQGTANITVDASSQVISSTNNTNILTVSGDSTINIGSTGQTGTAEFKLTGPASVNEGQQVTLDLMARSDTDEVNLFDGKLQFDRTKLQVASFNQTGSVVTQWAEQFSDNNTGDISVMGGVPSPGIKTTGQDVKIISIVFNTVGSGSTDVLILPGSGILRNSDNEDILGTRTNATINIAAVQQPSPSPSAQASAQPSPSAQASAQPSPSVQVSPSAQASIAPSPSPTTCALTNAVWNNTTNPVVVGSLIPLTINGNSACDGRQVSIEVRQDNFPLGFDPVKNNPVTATFNGSVARTSWIAEFMNDILNGSTNPPEYNFIATLVGTNESVTSSEPKLEVIEPTSGTFRKGDGNRDSIIDRRDLSVMMTNWTKTSGIPAEIDINDDSLINAVDFTAMIVILKNEGVIR